MSFKRNVNPSTPWLPIAGPHDPNPSPQVSQALEYFKNIKILQDQSRTKSVPYKNWFESLTPSESIANSYTPSASKFHIKKLGRKRYGKTINTNNLTDNEEFKYPSFDDIKAHEKKINLKKNEKDKLLESVPENIISLVDLADGSWLKRKAEKQKENLEKREADLPRSIESQREELLAAIKIQQEANIRDIDIEKILFLKTKAIMDFHLEPYDFVNIKKAQYYKDSIRFAIVDYILLDPAEKIRLMIDTVPIEYPVIQIRAPIPWHQAITLAGHKIEHNLFIGNEILRNIRDLYILKYNNMRIIHVSDFGKLPISALDIESIVENLCQESSKKLEEECGNLFVGPYEDLTFNNTPFMKIFIEPELGTSELHLKPTIDEIYNAVSRCRRNNQ
ncbi:dynein axonemal heavy chain 3-like [Aphidius gifuensis]|uniref:dynein axonemal heavy chain 3-like n=1 Tax=Aphidius gifuensis TaxID=684658 RepID=UPI001CDB976A|nr:dynein axonemal heavy chain 3-like [Aphidius gifuensis]